MMNSGYFDERVVGLGFDNKQFESGTKESIQSLDALKKGLNFDESVSQLGRLSDASRSFDTSFMGNALGAVTDRFSLLGAVGLSVIHNLTTSIMNFGKQLYTNMFLPMKQGMREYELQMDSVQTIMANTQKEGTTLKDVTAALDELNTYADMTIYNFGQMTRNIGTFTAAGVKLDTSVQAIKGIANLAAVSGSNAQQASTAMYQLSQAISAGTVRLMDWNSVVNAGMGGQVFQDALMETARVNGVAIDSIIKKQGSFRNSLQEGWLTSDIMVQTLAKFTGDLSEEQLKNIGYTEEQIVEIIKLGEMANDAATKVKTLTQLKDTLAEARQSGWAKTWQLIIGDFEEAKELFTVLSDTLGGYIGRTADARNEMLSLWATFGGRENLVNVVLNALESFAKVLEIGTKAFREFFPEQPQWMNLLNITRALERLSDIIKWRITIHAEELGRIFGGVFAVLRIGYDIVSNLATSFLELFKTNVKFSGWGILEGLAKIGDFFINLQKTLDIKAAFATGLEFVNKRIQSIKIELEKLVDGVKERIAILKVMFSGFFNDLKINFGPVKDFFKNLFSGVDSDFKPLESLLKGFSKVMLGLLDVAIDLGPAFLEFAGNVKEGVKNVVSGLIEELKKIDFKKLFGDIGEAFGVVNAGLLSSLLLALRKAISSGSGILGSVNAGLLSGVLVAIQQFVTTGSGILSEAKGSFAGIKEVLDGIRGSFEALQQSIKSKVLKNIAISIGLLAVSLIALSFIDAEKLLGTIGAVTALFLELMGAQAALSKIGPLDPRTGTGLIIISGALLVLSLALSKLSKIDDKALAASLGVLYGLLAGLAAFARLMKDNKANFLASGVGMIALGAAIYVLSFAIEKLGKMDPEILGQGLLAVAASLAELALFSKLTGNGLNLIATALSIIVLGLALAVLIKVFEKFADMSLEDLGTGLLAVAASLLLIAGAMHLMPKDMILQSVSLLIIAGALLILAEVITKMSNLSWEEVARGLVTMAGSLAIIALALYAMSGTLAGSLALLIASAALTVLAGVLERFGAMSLEEIGTGLLALAGIFVILGLAGLILTPLVPTLLLLGAAMLLIGAGAALIGAGLFLFATGLMMIGAGGAAAALGIAAFVTVILDLLPKIVTALIDVIIAFAEGITEAGPALTTAFTAMILGLLQVIIDIAPKLFETLGVLLTGLLELINEHVPAFVETVLNLIVTILQTIAEKLPDFLQAGFDIIISFLEGVRDNIPEVIETAVEVIAAFLTAVGEEMPKIIQSGFDLIIDFINGLNDGIIKNQDRLNDAIAGLATTIIDGLVNGLGNGAQKVIDAIVNLAKKAIGAAWDAFDSNSPSEEMVRLAETIPAGLVSGLDKYGYKAVQGMSAFGKKVLDSASLITSAISDEDFSPVITPVMDMDALARGVQLAKDALNLMPLEISPSVKNITAINEALKQNEVKTAAGIDTSRNGANVNFVQNNYSPKALSRFDIYRQTKNELLMIKGLGV